MGWPVPGYIAGVTPDDRNRWPSEREDASQADPDEYEPSGDEPWSTAGAEDPEEVASGDRPAGSVDPRSVPSGESEEDLAEEDLGVATDVDETLGDDDGGT
jgi:hypothetical protein